MIYIIYQVYIYIYDVIYIYPATRGGFDETRVTAAVTFFLSLFFALYPPPQNSPQGFSGATTVHQLHFCEPGTIGGVPDVW